VILWALRWQLAFPTSYRDLSAMLSDRSIPVDHTILFRWVQAYGFCCKDLALVAGHLREDEIASQAAIWNSPAMNSA